MDGISSTEDKGIKILTIIAGSIGALTLACLMFLIATDVILRYIFSRPIAGSFELVEIAMMLIVFLGLSNTYVNKGHISVDLIVSGFSKKARSISDAINAFIGFAVTALMTRQMFLLAIENWNRGQVTSTLGIPLHPARFLAAFGMAMFSLVFLYDVVGYFIKGVKR
jgi:TRAP-type C4-dicarboxylate transport system permease small subunit